MTARADEQSDVEMLAEARRLFDLGLDVVTIKPRTKSISLRGEYHGKRTSFGAISRRLSYSRDCGIGIRMGRDLVAIDIDPRAGGLETWRAAIKDRSLPPTAEAFSGGNGYHYVYRLPPGVGVDLLKSSLGPGVDLLTWSRYIVVAPTVHPSGNVYEWRRHPREGIGCPPDWLLAKLLKTTGGDPRPQGNGRRAADVPARIGDVGQWARWAIQHHRIPGPGNRHRRLAKLVPALVGFRLDDDTIMATVRSWWDYHFASGLCLTDPAEAEAEVIGYIGTVRGWDNFRVACSEDYHRERKRRIELTAEAYRRIGPHPDHHHTGLDQEEPAARGDVMRVTNSVPFQVAGIWTERICGKRQEAAFVEALAIHVHHQRSAEPTGPIRMTYDQVREVVADRHPDIKHWDNKQMGRFADKFIDRADAGKPAGRLSLLRRTVEGCNAIGKQAARPSEYEVTGLAAILDLGTVGAAQRGILGPGDQRVLPAVHRGPTQNNSD